MTGQEFAGSPDSAHLVVSGKERLGSKGRDLAPAVAASALIAAIAAIRLLVLARQGHLVGVDNGNWLAFGYKYLGQAPPDGTRSVYPPVVPLVTVAFVSALGPHWGVWLAAVLAGCAPAIGVYLVLRRCGFRYVASVLAATVGAAAFTGDPVAWGGQPQLLGLGLTFVALYYLTSLLRQPSARQGWVVGSLILGVGATSDLMFALLVVTSVLLLALHVTVVNQGLAIRGPWRGIAGWWRTGLRVIAPSLLLAPLYLRMTGSVAVTVVATSRGTSLPTVLEYATQLYSGAPLLWRAATVLALGTPVLLWSARLHPLWLISASILLVDATLVLVSGQYRFIYLLPLGVVAAIALWVETIMRTGAVSSIRVRTFMAAAGLALVVVAAMGGLLEFPSQVRYFGPSIFPKGTVAALTWLSEHTPPRSVVAVPPVDGFPFGWWVEGYAHRASLTGSLAAWLNFPDERRRAREAVSLFELSSADVSRTLSYASRLGVDYLYIPSTWAGLDASGVGQLVRQDPQRVVFRSAGAIVVQIAPPARPGATLQACWEPQQIAPSGPGVPGMR